MTGKTEQCNLAPEGWTCTRTLGHTGPCAAIYTRKTTWVDLPPINEWDHPESHTMVWSKLEIQAIKVYAIRARAPLLARIAELEAQLEARIDELERKEKTND
jgi:hypothetical protein